MKRICYPLSLQGGRTRRPLHRDHFRSIVLPRVISLSFLIRPQKFCGSYKQIHLVGDQEKLGEEMTAEFGYEISFLRS
jgi:hypothetical protein